MVHKKKYCILGESLKHTMSPPIHNRLFEISGREAEYSVVEYTSDELLENYHLLNKMNGYNVTIPYKVEIISKLDELDETALRYGAVNCVDIKDGKSKGYNTDVHGFLRSLESENVNLSGNVLLIGSGGVGRMMAIEACLKGANLVIAVLESVVDEAKKVKEDILKICGNSNVTITTLDKIEGEFDLLINSTPVGMYPKVDSCVVGDEVIKKADAVFDAIYNPKETLLMKKARDFGKKAIGGMAMLVWQAVSAHEIWDNDFYKDEDLKKLIEDMEHKVERDFQ